MIKKILSLLFAVLSFSAYGQTFYDLNTIQKIEIQFSQSNWDYILDTAKSGSEGYLMAQWVKVNGVQYDSVGVKYKGNSSYNSNNAKNPFHISLDEYISGQDYQGYSDIKLGNGKSDPSFVREVLSYKILKQYMHCPRANFAQVYVNGTLRGLYSNAEAINKKFVGDHFYSTGNSLFKCNPQQVMTNNGPGLTYLGSDSSFYYSKYEMKSNLAWKDLINLCDSLANKPSTIHTSLDVDRALWMLAFNNVLVNLDSYTGSFIQNYYLYRDNNNRFNTIIWDLNMSFGSFASTGSGTPLSVTGMQQMSPTLNSTSSSRPLLKQLLAIPMYKKMYIAHMRTITAENFSNGNYINEAQSLMATIDTAVLSDVNKFYTYSQFQNGLTQNVTGMGTIPGIQVLMNARAPYLQGTTDFQQAPPVITSVLASPASPAFNATVTVTANVTNTNSSAVYLGYRYTLPDKFTRILMYDDGAHGDGASGDNVYGVSIPVSSAQIQYYIYAENNNAGMFAPERAEHEFYTITANVPMVNTGDLVINEIMAVNQTTVQDPNGQYADWIELYNSTASQINLGTLYLSDDYATPLKWAFPVNAVINPGSYAIVWADEDTIQNGLHSNFKLASGGEKLILSYANGTVLDSTTFGVQTTDISFGRCPNGSGPYMILAAPTYNAQNNCSAGVEENPLLNSVVMYPNPSSGIFNIISRNNEIKKVEVYNTLSELVRSQEVNTSGCRIDLSSYPAGMYFVNVDGKLTRKVVIFK